MTFMETIDNELEMLTTSEAKEIDAIASLAKMSDEEILAEYNKIEDGPSCQYEAAVISEIFERGLEYAANVPEYPVCPEDNIPGAISCFKPIETDELPF